MGVMTDKDSMNLSSQRFKNFIIGFFTLALVLVGEGLWASDQVTSTCVTNNCDSSPLSCTNEMVQTAGQLECERLRSADSEEFLGPNGYCACLSSLGAKTRGAGYMYLSERRVQDIEKLTRDTILKDFANEYLQQSREFSELYFSAKTSGFYKEGEIEAYILGMPFAEMEQLPAEQKSAKMAEAKEYIASCSGTRLYDEMQAQREGGYCNEAGPLLVEQVIAQETRDNDGNQAYDNFFHSLSRAGVSAEEIRIRFIEFKSTETLVNNELARNVIGERYSDVLSNIQNVRPVTVDNLINLELVTNEAARSPGERAKQVMAQIMNNLVDLTALESSSEEYKAKSTEIENLVHTFPSYAKLIRGWGGEGNREVQAGVAKFIADNKSETQGRTSEEMYEFFERKIAASQRELFSSNLNRCKQRENKRKMLCEAYKGSGHSVHISDLVQLNPANINDYAGRIIASNQVPEDEQPLLRQHLDILVCASNAPRASLCRIGSGSRQRYSQSDQRSWDHLDFTTMLLNERRECSAGLSTSIFYPGWKEGDKEDVIARNSDPSLNGARETPWGAEAGTEGDDDSRPSLAADPVEQAFLSDEAVARGLEDEAGDQTSRSGLFGSIDNQVRNDLSRRYADRDRAVVTSRGFSSPGVMATTTSNIAGVSAPNADFMSSSASSRPDTSAGRAPASLASSVGEMVSSTLRSNTASAPAANTNFTNVREFVSELVDDEGNLTENYEEVNDEMSEKEKDLVSEIARIKAELSKYKSEAQEKEKLDNLSAQFERERELKKELEKKSNELASAFQARTNTSSNNVAQARAERPTFAAPRVFGSVSSTPAPVSTRVAPAPAIQNSGLASGRIANPTGPSQAAAGVNLNRSSLPASGGLTLIASGNGVFKVEGGSDPSALSAEQYDSIKSALDGSHSQVVVEFPDGRRYIYTENPETDELIQMPAEEAIFSLADLKRLDEGLEHQDDPVARMPASVVDLPELEKAPAHKWSDVLNILRESGASSGQ